LTKARLTAPLHGEKGLSLTELVVVLALLGLVLAITYPVFFFVQTTFNRASAESDALQQARLLMLQMEGEVREARKPSPALDAVVVPNPQRLDIYSDLNSDGRPEMISYRFLTGTLQRRVIAPVGTVFPFSYPVPNPDNTWATVLTTVTNSDLFVRHAAHAPRFTVTVTLNVSSAERALVRPVSLRADLTVRGGSEAK